MTDIPVLDFAAKDDGSFPEVLTGDTAGEQALRLSGGPPLQVVREHGQVVSLLTNPAAKMAGAAGEKITRCPLTGAEMQHPDGGWLNMDGLEHRTYRQLTGHLFSSREATATAVPARLIALSYAAALPRGGITDVRAAFTRPFSRQVIASTMGIPSSVWPQLERISSIAFGVVYPHAVDATAAAWGELYDFWEKVIDDVPLEMQGGLASRVIVILRDAGYRRDQIAHVLGVISNGFGAVEPVLSVMMAELARDPGIRHSWTSIVHGLLHDRAMFPVALPRLLAGSLLLPSLAAARLPFGAGPHRCPGDSLSLVWLATALETFWETHPDARLAGVLRWQSGTLSTPVSIPLDL